MTNQEPSQPNGASEDEPLEFLPDPRTAAELGALGLNDSDLAFVCGD